MSTLILEVPEVNSIEAVGVILADDWAMSDEEADAMAAEHEAEAAWELACDLGHGCW